MDVLVSNLMYCPSWIEVDAEQVDRLQGLAVHPAVGESGYTLTHIASGRYLGIWPTEGGALDVRKRVLDETAVDWSKSLEDVRDHPDFEKAKRIVAESFDDMGID